MSRLPLSRKKTDDPVDTALNTTIMLCICFPILTRRETSHLGFMGRPGMNAWRALATTLTDGAFLAVLSEPWRCSGQQVASASFWTGVS